MKFPIVMIVLAVIVPVQALKCYQCNDNPEVNELPKCDSQKEKNCDAGQGYCLKLTKKSGNGTFFAKVFYNV
jgi:hypothetical protein